MIYVAVVRQGFVVNTIFFAEEDQELISQFDFEQSYGEGAYGVVLEGDVMFPVGSTYIDGEFTPPPPPEPTHEELVREAENQKIMRVNSANSIFLIWQTKLLLNRATDEEKVQLNAWIDYVEGIQAIDTQQAPDIEWPEQPEIPEGGK